jgi:hypothetical protein
MAHYGKTAVVVDGVTPLHYALSQPGVIFHYLYLSIWPVAQCLDYGWPVADSLAAILPPTIIVTGLLAATIWCIFHRPHIGFAAGGIFLILAPTSSVMPIADLAFEHRMYLPLAALCTLSVVAGFEFLQWLIRHRPPRRGVFVAGAVTALVASSTILGGLSYRRNQDYQSAISIWFDVIQKAPHHTRGYNNLRATPASRLCR